MTLYEYKEDTLIQKIEVKNLIGLRQARPYSYHAVTVNGGYAAVCKYTDLKRQIIRYLDNDYIVMSKVRLERIGAEFYMDCTKEQFIRARKIEKLGLIN
jgi:hypothetical protein